MPPLTVVEPLNLRHRLLGVAGVLAAAGTVGGVDIHLGLQLFGAGRPLLLVLTVILFVPWLAAADGLRRSTRLGLNLATALTLVLLIGARRFIADPRPPPITSSSGLPSRKKR